MFGVMDAIKLRQTIDWLVDGARSARTPMTVLRETCERLVAAGLPLWRVAAFVRSLHPDVYGRRFLWRPGAEIVVTNADLDFEETPEFVNSPVAVVYRSGKELRWRADGADSPQLPFFDDMRAEGVTDYIGLPLLFTDSSTHMVSFTTRQQGGFDDEQLAALRAFVIPFSRLAEIWMWRRTAATLLDTYVGNR